MPIIAKKARDPLALRPVDLAADVPIAEAEVYDPLVRDLEQYADGGILGRSFLISGHRGSGKTTLVRKAIEDVSIKAIERGVGRPFPVELHGPNLLDPRFRNPRMLASASTDASTDVAAGDRASSDTMRDILATEQMLSQITVELYRALAIELGRAYRKYLEDRVGRGEAYPPQVLELAGQLTLELDDGPNPALLREFWRQAGALETGVLFADPDKRPKDQGVLEVVALATAASAYRRVAGVYEGGGPRETGSIQAEQEQRSVSPNGQPEQTRLDLATPLNNTLGIVAGIAAGASVFFGTGAGGAAADVATVGVAVPAVGIATALATVFGLHRVQSQKRSFAKEYTFIRDHSISTLDRELPNLIRRIREAGMAPVFIVDELDKVKDLAAAMNSLVTHLKHIVTERCFFCFLTDRNYYEYLRLARATDSYTKEHTYFTEQLFVTYRPQDLHSFLENTFVAEDEDPSDARGDLATLRHLILYRARLHPFDIQTEIAQLCDRDGQLKDRASDLRSLRHFRFRILIQLGVECLIETGELKERIARDPYFTQLAYDALYYPSRRWEQNRHVDLSRDVFSQYLRSRSERIGPQNESGADGRGLKEEQQRFIDDGALASDLRVTNDDVDLLRRQVRKLLEYLKTPNRISQLQSFDPRSGPKPDMVEDVYWGSDEVRTWWAGIPPHVVRAVSSLAPLVSGRDDVYDWAVDPYGQTIEQTVSPAQVGDRVDLIEKTNAFVRLLSDNQVDLAKLADRYGVLSTTPGWPTVQAAIDRTGEEVEPRAEGDALLDREAIDEYAFMLEQYGKALGTALILAMWIGRASQAAPPEGMDRGLATLADLLALPSITDLYRVEKALDRAWQTLDRGDPPDLPLDAQVFEAWRERIGQFLSSRQEPLDKNELSASREQAWAAWIERISLLFSDDESAGGFELQASELYCRAAEVSPSTLLRLDLDRMTLASWSEVLRLSVEDIGAHEADYAPSWLIVPALVRLGLGAACEGVLDQLEVGPSAGFLRRKAQDGELERAAEWCEAARRKGWARRRKACCIVSKADSRLTGDWVPSSRYGAVLLSREHWRQSAQPLDQILSACRSALDVTCVMVEIGDEHPTPSVPPLPALRGIPVVCLAARQPAEPDPAVRTIIAPRSFDAAMRQVLK